MSVDLIGPDGKEYAFDGDSTALENAKAKGFRVAADIGPVESALDTAKATGLGAVQGLTAGLFGAGAAAKQGAEETPESAQARWSTAGEVKRAAEEHPIANTVGEVAGMLTSPINAVGAAVEGPRAATVLGRLGQKALGGAYVGSLYGAGNTISEATLGDTQLTAEKLVAGAGLGALLGGLGGGIGGAIEEGAAKVLPKLGTMIKGGQAALDDVANDAAISATRAQQNVINKVGDDKLREVAQVLRDRGHLQLTPDAMAESIAKDREQVGKVLGKFIDDAEAAGKAPDHARLLQRLDDFEKSLNPLERDSIKGDISSARDAVAELGSRPAGTTGKAGSGFRALDDVKQTIQAKAKFSRGPVPLDDVTFGLRRQLSGVVRDELDQQLLPQLGSAGAKAFTESKATYGALKDAQRLAESGASRVGGRGALAYVGLKDLLAGNLLSGSGHIFGVAGAIGAKLIREQGPAIAARIADRIAKSPALVAVADSFAAALPTVAPKLGSYGPSLMLAAERTPALALAQHMMTAQLDPTYAAHAQIAGLTPEAPDEHEAALGKATNVAALHGAMQAHNEAIETALGHVVKGTKPERAAAVLKTQDFGSKQMRQDSQAAHAKRVEEVRRLATDPQALVDMVSANTTGMSATPSVTAHLTAVADRAVKYLAKQAEVPPKPGPLAREWTPTDAERHAFALKLEAVQEPMSVMRHAARGTLTQQQIDAVAAVYPSFHAQLRDKALERLLSGEPVPYGARLMLSKLAGVDADGTTAPRAIAMNQQAIATAHGKPSERMPSPPPPADMKLKQAERTALPSERRQLGALET